MLERMARARERDGRPSSRQILASVTSLHAACPCDLPSGLRHRRAEADDVAIWVYKNALVLSPLGVFRTVHVGTS